MADLLTDQLRTDYGTLSYGLISDASGYTFGGALELRGSRYNVSGLIAEDGHASIWLARTPRGHTAASGRVSLMESEIRRAFNTN